MADRHALKIQVAIEIWAVSAYKKRPSLFYTNLGRFSPVFAVKNQIPDSDLVSADKSSSPMIREIG